MMKLVLHVGTEKTGTTSIQSWLEANKSELSRRKVFLSDVLEKPSNRALGHAFQDDVDHYFLPMGVTTLRGVEAFRKQLTHELRSEVRVAAENHDYMVISSEQLQSRLLSTQEVVRLAHFMRELFPEITVVCYLRHQLEMRRSFYSTLVRMGYTNALEDFDADIDEASRYYNHEALIKRWETAFGHDNLLLREYAREKLHGSDVVQDFVTTALPDLDPSGLDFSRVASNTSLSSTHSATYLAINRWLNFSDGKGGLRKGNARAKRLTNAMINPLSPLLKRPSVSPREKVIGERIVARFAESNRRVSDEHFGGDLFSGTRQ